MANPEHLAILKQGVEVWNTWRSTAPGTFVDLTGVDCRGARLSGIILGKADLGEADFSGADLSRADLNGADLISTNLHAADLTGASFLRSEIDKVDLQEADLTQAFLAGAFLSYSNLRFSSLKQAMIGGVDFGYSDLSDADLTGALAPQTNFTSTIVKNADLSDMFLLNTVLADVDLSTVRGLESCRHGGPSTLDYRTLARSGSLSITFLRGCGLSDNMIDYLPSILGRPIQFYSCFVSYSTADQLFADRLYADLQANAVRCWFAPHSIKGGRKIREEIDEAIRLHDRLLLILSDHSMTSEWVQTEISNAREREIREKKQKIFPISLVPFEKIRDWKAFDADTGKDSAREIREYFIPNFSNWKDHDSYQKAFQRLLRDLKAE